MRWIAYVASLAGTLFVLQWILGFVFEFLGPDEDAPVFELFFALTAFTLVVGIPASYLIAIFRYGLWDLDVVVKKTIQYAVLAVAFSAVVGLILIVAPVAVVGVGGDPQSLPLIVIGVLLALGFLSDPNPGPSLGEPHRLRRPVIAERGDVGVRRPPRRYVFDG